jgi:competence protein ComEA
MRPGPSAITALCIAFAPAWCDALELNTASRAELEQLRALGPAKVEVLLEQRERAPYRDWMDLQRRVRGIGAKTAAQLSRDGLTVNGQPYRDPPKVPQR